jgi:SAM-dependent methyltransferase
LDSLEPNGTLKLRMFRIPNEFWKDGKEFLDIGCNKGFFSLYAKNEGMNVEGIDVDEKYVKLCKELGINAQTTTFRDWVPQKRYDRIMLGNVMHYCFRESSGWDFIIKLAAVSSGLVLIEAPTGMDCVGMKDAIPKHLRGRFNEELFYKKMGEFFELVDQLKSPSQGRLIMLWKRKPHRFEEVYDKTGAEQLKANNESAIYRIGVDVIKLQKNWDVKDQIRIFIASHSPISNGIKYYVDGGWAEEFNPNKKIRKLTRQEECLRLLAKHNVFLARLGYTEMDLSVVNFFEDLKFCDKGGVFPIKELPEGAITNFDEGWFWKMFRQSFNIIQNDFYDRLFKVMLTRDPEKFESFYSRFTNETFEKEKFVLKNPLKGRGLRKYMKLITRPTKN